MIISLILGFILGVGAIIFVLQNTAVVALTFLGWQFQSSLAVILFLALAVGVIVTALVSIPEAIKNGFKLSGLRKENKNLAAEVETQRHIAAEAANRVQLLEQQLGAVTGQPVQNIVN